MARLREHTYHELVDDFILDSEELETGVWEAYEKMSRKIALSSIVKGIFGGIGSFIGAVF